MRVYKKVILMTLGIFVFMMILIMTYDTETGIAPSVENSSLVILNDLMDKIINNIDDPFESSYKTDGDIVELEYLSSYEMTYKSSSSNIRIDNDTQKATITLPEYGEEKVIINLSITFEAVTRDKEFEVILYGKQEVYFSEYFHSDSDYSYLVLKNNSDHVVNLRDYEIKINTKGTSILKTFDLKGGLGIGDTVRLTTNDTFVNGDYEETFYNFSGEDIIYIYDDDMIIDAIGSGLTDLENLAIERTTETITQLETYSPADWDNKEFSIRLVVDGEEVSSSITGIYKGFARFPDLSKEGYTLSNWYYDSNLTNLYDEQYFSNENITLYATWELNS